MISWSNSVNGTGKCQCSRSFIQSTGIHAGIYSQASAHCYRQPRSLPFQRALQAMPNGTLIVVVPVSTTLRLSQLEATLSIYYNTAAVLIIFGDSFVSNLKLKCAICTGYELISKSRWMNVLYLNKLFVEYKT